MEDADGLRNLEKVLDASDGIIVARGTLGLELSPETVALAQNLCVTKCNIRGKVSPRSLTGSIHVMDLGGRQSEASHGSPCPHSVNQVHVHSLLSGRPRQLHTLVLLVKQGNVAQPRLVAKFSKAPRCDVHDAWL